MNPPESVPRFFISSRERASLSLTHHFQWGADGAMRHS
jgi:hypothetical protein